VSPEILDVVNEGFVELSESQTNQPAQAAA
jgi:hypothetical protein